MIIYKCDICKKKVDKLDTVILYSKRLDYCEKCNKKVAKMRKTMKYSIDYYNKEYDEKLKQIEESIISRRTNDGPKRLKIV